MRSASTAPPRLISVIVCTYNRAQSVYRTLLSLSLMAVPADVDWEVLILTLLRMSFSGLGRGGG
jgi:hypothetical protein